MNKDQPYLIDMSAWKPDMPPKDAMLLCRDLGLVELVMDAKCVYVRPTQTGVNVLYSMMRVVKAAADPDNEKLTSQ